MRLLIVAPLTRADHEALAVSGRIQRNASLPKVGSEKRIELSNKNQTMHLEPNWTVLYHIWRIVALDRNTEQGRI